MSIVAMSTVAMEQVQERTRQQQQIRHEPKRVGPMLPEQEERHDQCEGNADEKRRSGPHLLSFFGFAANSVERNQA